MNESKQTASNNDCLQQVQRTILRIPWFQDTSLIKWSEVPAVCISFGLSFRTCMKHGALTIQEKMQPRIRNWAASTPFCFISWRFGCKWPHQSLHIAVVLNHKDLSVTQPAACTLHCSNRQVLQRVQPLCHLHWLAQLWSAGHHWQRGSMGNSADDKSVILSRAGKSESFSNCCNTSIISSSGCFNVTFSGLNSG